MPNPEEQLSRRNRTCWTGSSWLQSFKESTARTFVPPELSFFCIAEKHVPRAAVVVAAVSGVVEEQAIVLLHFLGQRAFHVALDQVAIDEVAFGDLDLVEMSVV